MLYLAIASTVLAFLGWFALITGSVQSAPDSVIITVASSFLAFGFWMGWAF